MPLPRVRRLDDLYAEGFSPGRIGTMVHAGALVRVRAGAYVDGARWREATMTDRVVLRARALALVSRVRPVFSGETAAALHGLPLYRPGESLHVIAREPRNGAVAGVVRHRGTVSADDTVDVGGVLCTGLLRTLADIARTAPLDQAVTVADAVLRRRCVRGRIYDTAEASEVVHETLAIAARSHRGNARARRSLRFADGRAELPGESVSRVRLHELGFAPPDLQVRVAGPHGNDYFVDFGLDDARAFGEFDGRIKYVDGRMLDGRSSAEVYDREKRREDWIRGTTSRHLVRWGWSDIASAERLGARLEQFGVSPL